MCAIRTKYERTMKAPNINHSKRNKSTTMDLGSNNMIPLQIVVNKFKRIAKIIACTKLQTEKCKKMKTSEKKYDTRWKFHLKYFITTT